jgi:hypothetical protein
MVSISLQHLPHRKHQSEKFSVAWEIHLITCPDHFTGEDVIQCCCYANKIDCAIFSYFGDLVVD